MLSLSPSQRIFLALEPVDMRKRFDGLWALAREKLQEDPSGGAWFVFTNKGRNRLKILCWDGSGVWGLAERLGTGGFSWPACTVAKLDLEATVLTMLLSGIDLKDGCKKAWGDSGALAVSG